MHSTIDDLLTRRPFQPFEVRVSNGEAYQIRHPEMALLLKSNIILGNKESDEFKFVSLLHVVDVRSLDLATGAS